MPVFISTFLAVAMPGSDEIKKKFSKFNSKEWWARRKKNELSGGEGNETRVKLNVSTKEYTRKNIQKEVINKQRKTHLS
jgi:hypothetical protein